MKSDILLVVVLVCCTGAVSRAAEPGSAARGHAKEEGISVMVRKDWKGWLERNFPDVSNIWPTDCAKAFDLVVGDGKWDFVGKGNIDRDDVPTGLLVRVRSVQDADEEHLVVVDLRVVKWLNGKWETLLRLSADEGMIVGGVKPGAMQSPDFHGYRVDFFAGYPTHAQRPGMVILAAAVDEKGKVITEDAHVYYLPQLKKYGGKVN